MATSKFGEAFRAARKAGDKQFTFNGKKYTTEMAKPKMSTKPELGPEMGSPMSAAESKDAVSRIGYPKGSERLNSEENKDTSDMSYKRGGSVKPSKMGGVKTAKPSMGSASKRADGIASKGKTRGKYI